jgi:hypothetical protein
VRTGPDPAPGVVDLSFRSHSSRESRWRSVEQRLPITWTECHLGGWRPWFRCAACGRRVANLYDDGGLFTWFWRSVLIALVAGLAIINAKLPQPGLRRGTQPWRLALRWPPTPSPTSTGG